MNIVLILREEVVCLVLLVFMFVYSMMISKSINMNRFKRICIIAMAHVLLDLVTVCTVNTKDFPYMVNLLLHIIFYMTAILYTMEILRYALDMCVEKKVKKNCMVAAHIVCMVYLVVAPFIGVEIFHGKGTMYSCGMLAYVGYAIAYVFIVSSWLILIKNRKRTEKQFVNTFVPVSVLAVFIMTFQLIIPEMLITGGGVTVVTIGLFFAIENPMKIYKEKAYTDVKTGVKSRTAFEEDFERYAGRKTNDISQKIGIVVCDLNDLKKVNDTHGHVMGDRFIETMAEIIKEQLSGAKDIYRVGGDEFVAIYLGDRCELIEKEIKSVEAICRKKSKEYSYNIGIAIGYAINEKGEKLNDTYKKADLNMYKVKIQMKKNGG